MKRLALLLVGLAALWALPALAHDTVTYYYTNTLHSAVVETNAQGQVIERTYYAPYGQVLNRSMRDGPGYGGHEEDPATGLVYMQQRYYDPQSGRFLSTDPVLANGDGGSFNRYAYAKDNPYRYTDPFGMCTGSHISNGDGTCVSTGGYTTGTNGAAQGMQKRRAKQKTEEQAQQIRAAHASSAGQMMYASYSTTSASNSGADDSVKRDEAINAANASAEAYTKLVESGVLGSHAMALLAEMGSRGINAANNAYTIGTVFSGLAKITLVDAGDDLHSYTHGPFARTGPTGLDYPGSWINWGRIDWRDFDPGLDNTSSQIWTNFQQAGKLYDQSN